MLESHQTQQRPSLDPIALVTARMWVTGWLGCLVFGLAACDEGTSAKLDSTGCDAGATCADAAAAGDAAGNVYGDQHSGPLTWSEGGATVFDSQSGLLWQRDISTQKYTWDAAGTYCDELVLAGHDDWKVPHRGELESIVLNLTTAPSIDTTAFPDTPDKPFWTRTLWGPNAAMEAYGVDFKDGGTGHALKSEPHFVRCVRAPTLRN